MFLNEIRERTRVPLKISRPGTWKTETIEVPYEEIEADLNEPDFSITLDESEGTITERDTKRPAS
jgi:hypothetical protein